MSRLVLAGADPRQAAEPEPWPSWREDAQAALRAGITIVHHDVAASGAVVAHIAIAA